MLLIAYILDFLSGLAIDIVSFLLLARFLLQYLKSDFYNPAIQLLVNVTNPIVLRLRRVLPITRLDYACLLGVFLLGIIRYLIISILYQQLIPPHLILLYILIDTIRLVIQIYFWMLIFRGIISFLPTQSYYSPLFMLVYQITNPILAPFKGRFRRGGFDFSPMIVMIILMVALIILNYFHIR